MKKLTLNKITFAGATELTREQLKKVMGGGGYETTMPGVETTAGSICRFKYKYTDNPNESWTVWSDWVACSTDCNTACLTFIAQGPVKHCGYETAAI